jgi:hypothetical protein
MLAAIASAVPQILRTEKQVPQQSELAAAVEAAETAKASFGQSQSCLKNQFQQLQMH